MTLTEYMIIADTLRALGIILVALAAVNANLHIAKERILDDAARRSMARERKYALVGVALVVASYFVNVYSYMTF